MRDERSLLQRSGRAWLTGALALTGALTGASRASAQECGVETCQPGYVCAVSQGMSCSGCGPTWPSDAGARDAGSVPLPPPGKEDPDAGGCEVICVPTEYQYCAPAPCSANADCPANMVCHTENYTECSGGACKPGLDCGADGGGYTCTEHTRSTCAERHNVPCREDEDCGPGFDCNRDPYTTCSGGGGIEPGADGGWVFVDAGTECTTVTPELGWCSLQQLPCESDSECPDTFSCQPQFNYPPCRPAEDASVVPTADAGSATAVDGGISFPAEPDKDGGWMPWTPWECPPPVVEHVCRPESWGGGFTGGFGGGTGGGGYPDDAGASADAGTPPGAPGGGTFGGGGAYAGGTGGGSVGGTGSVDAGSSQGPGGGDEGEEDDDDHGHGHGHGSLLHKLLKRLLGSSGCSVAGETPHGNLAWLSALSLFLVARVRRRRG